jgi:prepilin-type N-terminal cleavage/methylation domain-containing protein
MPRTTKRSARRAGFTMVEMLVVITIIAILISLTAAAVLKIIPAQQAINTKTELTRLQGDLVRAYRSAADKFRKEPLPPQPQGSAMWNAYQSVLGMANNNPDLARVIWVKLRLKQTFPNNFAEAWSPGYPSVPSMPALSSYQTKLNALGYNATFFPPAQPNYSPAQWESSVCLLWALQRGEDGNALQESDIGTSSLKDFPLVINPNQTVKGLVDNWGTPLAFCRWCLINPPVPPNTIPTTNLANGDNNDSDDPTGLLESPAWQGSGTNFIQFQQTFHPLAQRMAGQPVKTYRVYPLVVSAGPTGAIIASVGQPAKGRLGLDKEPLAAPPGLAPMLEPMQYNFAVLAGPQGGFAANIIYPQLASPK